MPRILFPTTSIPVFVPHDYIMKLTPPLLLLAIMPFLSSCTVDDKTTLAARVEVNVCEDWLFSLTDYPDMPYEPSGVVDAPSLASPLFDDASWRTLNLPHDWAIEGEFSPINPSGTGGGALPGGIGWYRKHFTLTDLGLEADADRKYIIRFDGVYMNSTVWINGHELGTRPYGYISFEYDLTPYLNFDGENLLAVRVDNSDQPNSRWYSGCGIFRNVYVTSVHSTHIVPASTYFTAPVSDLKYSYNAADGIVVGYVDDAPAGTERCLEVIVTDAEGIVVSQQKMTVTSSGECSIAEQHCLFALDNPTLWSISNPYLYNVRVNLYADADKSNLLDDYNLRLGFRSFRFDPDKGFSLNGVPMKLNGVCNHHDLGCLGSAVNRRALQRQLEIMRGMGVNAIRCSHNPPSVELLDLCDEMGFLVMDEAFDMWRRRKTQRDYARFFDEWHERDLSDLITRDRNHPSIILWSIGNEILEQWHSADTDGLTLEDANLILNAGHEVSDMPEGETHFNSLLTRHMCDIVRRYDMSRPITAGCNETSPGNLLFRSGAIDIIGFNYHERDFDSVPARFPGKPFIVSESVSSLHTRGHYRMPSDHAYIWPSRWDRAHEDSTFMCSAYDNCHAPWSSTHERNLSYTEHRDFIAGQFIWTGFDYLGEPTPYGWPARSSYFGIVDLAGFPKDVYWLYKSLWTDDDVLHVFPHWTWNIDDVAESRLADGIIDVWAYFNHADEAELFINGVSQGTATKGDAFHTAWRVHYEPGELRVITRKDGRIICEKNLVTAESPHALRLTPDRRTLTADGLDLSFVTVEVVDVNGNLCPWADCRVDFSTTGPCFIAGVDNGLQTSMESFKASFRNTFHGKCLVVLQNDGNAGSSRLTATADGLKSDKVKVTWKK